MGRTRDQANQKIAGPKCLAEFRGFQATGGSTAISPLVLGAETVLRPRAAKKSGKWYRGLVNAELFHYEVAQKGEAERSWLRHAAVGAKSGDRERGGGGGAVLRCSCRRMQKRDDLSGGKVSIRLALEF